MKSELNFLSHGLFSLIHKKRCLFGLFRCSNNIDVSSTPMPMKDDINQSKVLLFGHAMLVPVPIHFECPSCDCVSMAGIYKKYEQLQGISSLSNQCCNVGFQIYWHSLFYASVVPHELTMSLSPLFNHL